MGGTYAMPTEPSEMLVSQLRGQHLAQARLYGGAPSAAAFVPPPPTRGRSAARATSAVREPFELPIPTPANIGYLICRIISYVCSGLCVLFNSF